MINTVEIRKQFPILKNKIVLSSCSQSAISESVLTAMAEYQASLLNNGMDWEIWMEKVQDAKAQFAKLINCKPEEIAILGSVSDCISSVVNTLEVGSKNKLAVTELDFPTIGHVLKAQQREVVYIPQYNNIIDVEQYSQSIDEKTMLTCITQVSFYNGFKQDVKSISKIVHEKGSYLFVDAYQSAGNVAIDVKEMGIDFLAAGTQKYLLGIPGISFLYINEKIASHLNPVTTGWFGQNNPFAFNIFKLDFAQSTQRFNTGTPPVINAYVAHAGLKMINQIGPNHIYSYLNELAQYAYEIATEYGFKIASPEDPRSKGSNTAIYIPDAHKIEVKLKERNIIVSARKDVIRIAPHFYNTKEDIKTTIEILRKII